MLRRSTIWASRNDLFVAVLLGVGLPRPAGARVRSRSQQQNPMCPADVGQGSCASRSGSLGPRRSRRLASDAISICATASARVRHRASAAARRHGTPLRPCPACSRGRVREEKLFFDAEPIARAHEHLTQARRHDRSADPRSCPRPRCAGWRQVRVCQSALEATKIISRQWQADHERKHRNPARPGSPAGLLRKRLLRECLVAPVTP